MARLVSRRSLLKGLVAGATIVGFDVERRSWVTSAHAATGCAEVPALDGQLLTDEGSRQQFGEDFGHIFQRVPFAILVPGSVEDIVKMVRYARCQGLKVATRGHGHSNYGQAQAAGGIIIDSQALDTIHGIEADRAVVDPGVSWGALLDAAVLQGLTPPVLTDFQELTVGGTLSVGGLGGTGLHYGLQVDNVLELEVVTGTGDLLVCSPSAHPELFNAVLAGLGQCGVIVRATVRLIPAPTRALALNLYYDDLALFMHDQELLLAEGRFSYLEGQIVRNTAGTRWRYMIEAVSYYTPPPEPDLVQLLAGLSDDVASRQITPYTYQAWQYRIAPLVEVLKATGSWSLPHPWYVVFIPRSATHQYISDLVANLTVADTGNGPILFYPVRTDRYTRPLFRVPAEPVAYAFSLLRTASDAASAQAMLASNRTLYDQLVALGGTRYAIGAIPNFTTADWRAHFGSSFTFLSTAKRIYDPDNVLTPGQGIF